MLARLAARHGIPHAVSTAASTSLEDIAPVAGGNAWFQLYFSGNEEAALALSDHVPAARSIETWFYDETETGRMIRAIGVTLTEAGDEWRKQLKPDDTVLVCDVGGGTTDLTLVDVVDEGGASREVDGESGEGGREVGGHGGEAGVEVVDAVAGGRRGDK